MNAHGTSPFRICRQCRIKKPLKDFEAVRIGYLLKYTTICKECIAQSLAQEDEEGGSGGGKRNQLNINHEDKERSNIARKNKIEKRAQDHREVSEELDRKDRKKDEKSEKKESETKKEEDRKKKESKEKIEKDADRARKAMKAEHTIRDNVNFNMDRAARHERSYDNQAGPGGILLTDGHHGGHFAYYEFHWKDRGLAGCQDTTSTDAQKNSKTIIQHTALFQQNTAAEKAKNAKIRDAGSSTAVGFTTNKRAAKNNQERRNTSPKTTSSTSKN